MADQFRVALGRQAAAELKRLPRQPRGRLKMMLLQTAWREPHSGLLVVWAWRHLAACEILGDRRVMLVYAVLDRRKMLRELFGHELDDELRARDGARWMHGRR